MIKNIKGLWRLFTAVVVCSLAAGCVEPMDIETGNYDNALVVEGTITSELTFQEILLSRTYELEENGPSKESGAEVNVVSNGNTYEFWEVAPGRYRSTQPFQAVAGEEYVLEITTSDGEQYASEPEKLPENSSITSLYAQKITLEGQTGVVILADIAGPAGASGYYKYNYSETYKIVSPFKSNWDLEMVNGEFVRVRNTAQETVCYATNESNEIILANTNEQAGNDLDGLFIKFMNRESFKTAYRYSILVKQYAISGEAFSYHQTLRDFSQSESLFTQNQLGLINGNISSVSDPDEAVVGLFEVAAVSSERIFFDFEDFYDPNDFRPDAHVEECEAVFPPTATPAEKATVMEALAMGRLKYLGFDIQRGHRFARAECVDCTVFGTNVPPDFWEE